MVSCPATRPMPSCTPSAAIRRGWQRRCSTDRVSRFPRRSPDEGRYMTAANYHEEMCRTTQQHLNQWQGGFVQLWAYTVTHATLILRMVSHDRPGNLHLECSACLRISGPVFWECGNLQLHTRPDENGETVYVVCDDKAGFQVICR